VNDIYKMFTKHTTLSKRDVMGRGKRNVKDASICNARASW